MPIGGDGCFWGHLPKTPKDILFSSLNPGRKEYNLISNKTKQRIKFGVVLTIICIAIAVAIFMVMKYEVEGEKEVPYGVKKIIVISSAYVADVGENDVASNVSVDGNEEKNANIVENNVNESQENVPDQVEENQSEEQKPADNQEQPENAEQPATEEKYLWEKDVIQTNDICIQLEKNENFKEEQIIKSVKIENIKLLQNVKIGKIQVYMPSSLDGNMYRYINDYLVNSTLTYTGGMADDKKNLQVRNQGGCVYINFANVGLGEYKSNEDQEIQQGAYILEKMNVANDDLKFKVSFDLVIEVQDKAYKTNIELDLPVEGVVGQKETHTEITDFSNLIFKRQ